MCPFSELGEGELPYSSLPGATRRNIDRAPDRAPMTDQYNAATQV